MDLPNTPTGLSNGRPQYHMAVLHQKRCQISARQPPGNETNMARFNRLYGFIKNHLINCSWILLGWYVNQLQVAVGFSWWFGFFQGFHLFASEKKIKKRCHQEAIMKTPRSPRITSRSKRCFPAPASPPSWHSCRKKSNWKKFLGTVKPLGKKMKDLKVSYPCHLSHYQP